MSSFKDHIYIDLFTPFKSYLIRHKRHIHVVFVVSELGCWKTELLYRRMLEHPRFKPHIAVSKLLGTKNDAVEDVIKYLSAKGYEYKVLDSKKKLSAYFHTRDIIFYQQPYNATIYPQHRLSKNLTSLFCYVGYGMFSTINSGCFNHALFSLAWQIYFDNNSTIHDLSNIMGRSYKNAIVTGHPTGDEFLQPIEKIKNPWKIQSKNKKRIIWAPHHTLPDDINPWLMNSTFWDYYETMLELAKKYKDNIQFAFKPHPMLRAKLEARWGKDRTDEYYAEWQNRSNTQLEEGKYIGLFMHSDAMIHDCDSFIVEYQYTGKPVLFCENGNDHRSSLSSYAKEAYDLHNKAYSKADIEQFILNVIDGKDELEEARKCFFAKHLLPPDGKTACENIIDNILGK